MNNILYENEGASSAPPMAFLTHSGEEITDVESAARALAEQGVPVFPCTYGKKTPSTTNGFKAATTDSRQVAAWFRDKRVNLAIPTGEVSGRIVIDDDSYHEGGSGFDALEAELGRLPETFTVRTRAGGRQYHFAYPDGYAIKCSAGRVTAHVDIRGDGGYVLMPPSWVGADDKGQAGFYNVENDIPLAALPRAWAERLASPMREKDEPKGAALADLNSGHTGFILPDTMPKGTRDDTLLRYAGHLRGRGVPQDLIEQFLRDANRARCKPPMEDCDVIGLARRYAQPEVQAADWPEPKVIEFGLPEVPTFDPELMPDAFREFVTDEAERMQSPPEYLAVPLMVGAAAALGNCIAIAPKATDTGWRVYSTIWGAIVGRPGSMKSPAMDAALRPLHILEAELADAFAEKQRGYAVAKVMYDADKARVEKAIRQGTVVRPEDMPAAPEEPQPERLVVNDSTVAKLGEILRWAPRGVLVMRDELTGLLESLSAEGREGDRAFYLSGWNGGQSYRVDRIGRGSFVIPHLNVLLLGGIQPGKLQSYIRQAVHGGGGDDGLMQRLQLIVWPDPTRGWRNVDRPPNFVAQELVYGAFRRLRHIDPIAVGAKLPEIGGGPAWLHFSTEGQRLFDAWREKLETALRRGDRHPALESHMAKYRSLVPALALIIHLADGGLGPVDIQAVRKAIAWSKFLHKHAKRVYASVINSAAFSAKALADKISKSKLPDGFTLRDVYRSGWQHLGTQEEARGAVDWLVDAGWLRPERVQSGGRPGECYRINPGVNKFANGGGDASRVD